MNKKTTRTLRFAGACAVLGLFAGGCAHEHEAMQHAQDAKAPPVQRTGTSIVANVKSIYRAKPNAGRCLEKDHECRIDLEVDGEAAGGCTLMPAPQNHTVTIHSDEPDAGKRRMRVSWYIAEPLQHKYAYKQGDGIKFKRPGGQGEFDQASLDSAAEFSMRNKMKSKAETFDYGIQVTRLSDGAKCVVDPVIVNDW